MEPTPTMVLCGSAKEQTEIARWRMFWSERGYHILNYPQFIDPADFDRVYPQVHRQFFVDLTRADVVFILNPDRENVRGYIGAESFAELAFALAQKLVYKRDVRIIVQQVPGSEVGCAAEIERWLKLGWIELFV